MVIDCVANLPAKADRNWDLCVTQFAYILEWVLLNDEAGVAEKYSRYDASEDINIQLERLLFCINPSLPPPELHLEDVDEEGIDFGVVQAWSRPSVTFKIVHSGRGYLYGTIRTKQPWLRVTPEAYSGSTTLVTVELDASQLISEQDQEAKIAITSVDGRGKPTVLPVQMHQRTFFQSIKSLFNGG